MSIKPEDRIMTPEEICEEEMFASMARKATEEAQQRLAELRRRVAANSPVYEVAKQLLVTADLVNDGGKYKQLCEAVILQTEALAQIAGCMGSWVEDSRNLLKAVTIAQDTLREIKFDWNKK